METRWWVGKGAFVTCISFSIHTRACTHTHARTTKHTQLLLFVLTSTFSAELHKTCLVPRVFQNWILLQVTLNVDTLIFLPFHLQIINDKTSLTKCMFERKQQILKQLLSTCTHTVYIARVEYVESVISAFVWIGFCRILKRKKEKWILWRKCHVFYKYCTLLSEIKLDF